MFVASSSFLLFDYFRVPYVTTPVAEDTYAPARTAACVFVRGAESSKSLLWPRPPIYGERRLTGRFRLEEIPLFGSVLADAEAKHHLDVLGGKWHRSIPICDDRDTWVASVWIADDGSIFLPFDPDDAIRSYWSESYLQFVGSAFGQRLRASARGTYYAVRPFVPRQAQILARRCFSRVQSKTTFPNWPVETGLHDLYGFLFDVVAGLVSEPVPMISVWPSGHDWALVLTHDVESAAGYENIELLRDLEVAASYRSSWNFVPLNHHRVHDSRVRELKDEGFEVGVHGLRHDGRDISELPDRLSSIHEYASRWQASGFRSPATLRDWASMPMLDFDYDTTYFDTSPYEPQPGGCCTWLPYMIEDLVELPITLPQDHTLFEILDGFDETLWLEKARFIRDRGGMALALTHPDYARNQSLVQAYGHLLEEFEDDATAWKALPREVSAWWRRRSASQPARAGSDWTIVGPAADEGTVVNVEASR